MAATTPNAKTAPPPQTLPPGCAWCGYVLAGLPDHGVCPECGRPYIAGSRVPVEPWPHPLRIAFRVLWPSIIALFVATVVVLTSPRWSSLVPIGMTVAYILVQLIVAQRVITRLVERHMPERERQRPVRCVAGNLASAACSIIQMLLIGAAVGVVLGWLIASLLGGFD